MKGPKEAHSLREELATAGMTVNTALTVEDLRLAAAALRQGYEPRAVGVMSEAMARRVDAAMTKPMPNRRQRRAAAALRKKHRKRIRGT